jgi:regulator of replication initiation timing
MVTLEQIKLLDSKITKALGFISQLTDENASLKKQIEELKQSAVKLQEENSRVEQEFASALEKLNKFEDAIEQSLSSVKASLNPAQNTTFQQESVPPVSKLPDPLIPPTALEVKLSRPEAKLPAAPLAYTVNEEDAAIDADDAEQSEEDMEGTTEEGAEGTIEEDTEEESETDDSDGAELDIF